MPIQFFWNSLQFAAWVLSSPSVVVKKDNIDVCLKFFLVLHYTGSSGRARSTRADSTHAHYKNIRACIVNALKLPAKWVLFSIIHLDSTGAKSRSCGFF